MQSKIIFLSAETLSLSSFSEVLHILKIDRKEDPDHEGEVVSYCLSVFTTILLPHVVKNRFLFSFKFQIPLLHLYQGP